MGIKCQNPGLYSTVGGGGSVIPCPAIFKGLQCQVLIQKALSRPVPAWASGVKSCLLYPLASLISTNIYEHFLMPDTAADMCNKKMDSPSLSSRHSPTRGRHSLCGLGRRQAASVKNDSAPGNVMTSRSLIPSSNASNDYASSRNEVSVKTKPFLDSETQTRFSLLQFVERSFLRCFCFNH